MTRAGIFQQTYSILEWIQMSYFARKWDQSFAPKSVADEQIRTNTISIHSFRFIGFLKYAYHLIESYIFRHASQEEQEEDRERKILRLTNDGILYGFASVIQFRSNWCQLFRNEREQQSGEIVEKQKLFERERHVYVCPFNA